MEEMKQTGVQWIGEIPSTWNTKRIKYMATLKGRIGWQGLTSEEYQDEGAYLITGVDFANGGIDWDNCVHVPMKRWEEATDIQIEEGDLLITKDGTIGKVAIVTNMPGETSLNSGVLRIIPIEGYSRRFLYWVLKSDEFWNWFNYKNAGNSTIVHLYQGDFVEFLYAFPNFAEQEAIADYLDTRCNKLDKIIAAIQRQIDLLKQSKTSLIIEGVTKGIQHNPNLRKVSLDFAKEINSEWRITRIKYFCRMYSGDNLTAEDIDPDGDYPVYGGNGFRGYFSNYNIDGEYVLVGRQGAQCGNVHLVNGKFWATDHAVVTYPFVEAIDNRFMSYLFIAMNFNQYSQTAAQPGLAVSTIQNLKTCIPPNKAVQEEIATFLDKKCHAIDDVIAQKSMQLNCIEDYKKSLIFEYVTGKKRVKEVR